MFQTFSIALTAIISILFIMCLGVLLRRSGRIPEEVDHGMLRLMIDLLFPCLIFDRILRTDAFNNVQNLWLPPLLGFGMTAVGILIGFAVALLPARRTGLATWKQRRTFAACVGLLNYGYVPIPLVIALFPGDDRTMGVLFVQYLGSEISVWTLVIFSMMGRLNAKSWRHMINGPILAILIAVPLNLLGNSSLIPAAFHELIVPYFGFLLKSIHMIGQAAIPVSLIIVGLTITKYLDWAAIRQRWSKTLKISLWSCLIRLVIMPSLFLILAVFLPCTVEIKRILVVYGAMGSAVFPIVLAKHYKGSTETAFDTAMSNTLVSIVTLPFWIAFGLKMIS